MPDYLVAVVDSPNSFPVAGVEVEAVSQADGSILARATTTPQGIATFTGLSVNPRFVAKAPHPLEYQTLVSITSYQASNRLLTDFFGISETLADVTNCSLVLPNAGEYIIIGIFAFEAAGGTVGDTAQGQLDVAGDVRIPKVPWTPDSTSGLVLFSQAWPVTTTGSVTAKLQVQRIGATGTTLRLRSSHTQIVAFSTAAGTPAGGGGGGTDELVGVTSADSSPGYLDDKIQVTDLIKTIINPGGGNQKLQISGVKEAVEAEAALVLQDLEAEGYNLKDQVFSSLAGNAFTRTQEWHLLGAESGTADDLDTISGGRFGDRILLQTLASHDITVKHGTGNIRLKGGKDFVLAEARDTLELFQGAGTAWIEMSRSPNVNQLEDLTHVHPWQGHIVLATGLQTFSPT